MFHIYAGINEQLIAAAGAGLAADDLILTVYFTTIYALARRIPPEAEPDFSATNPGVASNRAGVGSGSQPAPSPAGACSQECDSSGVICSDPAQHWRASTTASEAMSVGQVPEGRGREHDQGGTAGGGDPRVGHGGGHDKRIQVCSLVGCCL
jgi:hypothetical protein